MIDVRFVPITNWPGKRKQSWEQVASPFSAEYASTVDLLDKELFHLGAKEVVIQAAFDRHQIRNDGWPRSGQRPTWSGLVVSFRNRKDETFAFPCDTFKDFEANLRAIALSLEALRKVDRYGVTRQHEQYQGWKQIEAPGAQPTFRNKEEAAQFIVQQAYGDGVPPHACLNDPDWRQRAYRIAAGRLHPDKPAGSHEMFVRLQQAMEVLGP